MPELTFLSPPRATLPVLERAMARVNSPATPYAASLYAIPIGYGLDPAVAWAFAQHEHNFFTDPNAVTVREGKNWGALRKGQGRAYKGMKGFAYYRTYEDGLHDWCVLIRKYIARGLDTVEKAVPVYAPSEDHNKPEAYIAFVRGRVQDWQEESGPAVDPWVNWGTAYPLAEEQRGFGIPQAWLRDGGKLGAACSYELPTPVGAVQLFIGGVIVWYQASNSTRIYR